MDDPRMMIDADEHDDAMEIEPDMMDWQATPPAAAINAIYNPAILERKRPYDEFEIPNMPGSWIDYYTEPQFNVADVPAFRHLVKPSIAVRAKEVIGKAKRRCVRAATSAYEQGPVRLYTVIRRVRQMQAERRRRPISPRSRRNSLRRSPRDSPRLSPHQFPHQFPHESSGQPPVQVPAQLPGPSTELSTTPPGSPPTCTYLEDSVSSPDRPGKNSQKYERKPQEPCRPLTLPPSLQHPRFLDFDALERLFELNRAAAEPQSQSHKDSIASSVIELGQSATPANKETNLFDNPIPVLRPSTPYINDDDDEEEYDPDSTPSRVRPRASAPTPSPSYVQEDSDISSTFPYSAGSGSSACLTTYKPAIPAVLFPPANSSSILAAESQGSASQISSHALFSHSTEEHDMAEAETYGSSMAPPAHVSVDEKDGASTSVTHAEADRIQRDVSIVDDDEELAIALLGREASCIQSHVSPPERSHDVSIATNNDESGHVQTDMFIPDDDADGLAAALFGSQASRIQTNISSLDGHHDLSINFNDNDASQFQASMSIPNDGDDLVVALLSSEASRMQMNASLSEGNDNSLASVNANEASRIQTNIAIPEGNGNVSIAVNDSDTSIPLQTHGDYQLSSYQIASGTEHDPHAFETVEPTQRPSSVTAFPVAAEIIDRVADDGVAAPMIVVTPALNDNARRPEDQRPLAQRRFPSQSPHGESGASGPVYGPVNQETTASQVTSVRQEPSAGPWVSARLAVSSTSASSASSASSTQPRTSVRTPTRSPLWWTEWAKYTYHDSPDSEPRRTTRSSRRIVEQEEARQERNRQKNIDLSKIVPLTEEWERRVREAVRSGHRPDYKAADFARVVPSTHGGFADDWLNDETVNGYLKLATKLHNRNNPSKIPKSHAFPSFMLKQIEEKGYKGVERWAKRAKIGGGDLLKTDTIFVPVNRAAHWTLMVVHPRKRTAHHYDSLGRHRHHSGRRWFDLLKVWLRGELVARYDEDEWSFSDAPSPQQNNMSDCGVFTVTTAKMLILGADAMSYGPTDIPTQRRRMVAELINGDFL